MADLSLLRDQPFKVVTPNFSPPIQSVFPFHPKIRLYSIFRKLGWLLHTLTNFVPYIWTPKNYFSFPTWSDCPSRVWDAFPHVNRLHYPEFFLIFDKFWCHLYAGIHTSSISNTRSGSHHYPQSSREKKCIERCHGRRTEGCDDGSRRKSWDQGHLTQSPWKSFLCGSRPRLST